MWSSAYRKPFSYWNNNCMLMSGTGDEHFGGKLSAQCQISMLSTEGDRYYPTISIWNSGKREVNGYDESCGSRISSLFIQVCCSAPLVLTITVDWITAVKYMLLASQKWPSNNSAGIEITKDWLCLTGSGIFFFNVKLWMKCKSSHCV